MLYPNKLANSTGFRLRPIWLTSSILVVSAAFRIAALQEVPPGLAQDEVLNADIVTLILQGKHALFFREGFGHEPLYHYWSVPFRVLLGDNVLSIRLPAMVLGMMLVAMTMRWAHREFGLVVANVTGLGMAVSWWPVIFSRIGLRPILEPVLLVSAAWFWSRRPRIAGLLLGLSLYSYTGARVVFLIPLLMIVYSVASTKRRANLTDHRAATASNAKLNTVIVVIAAVIYLPLGVTLWSDPALEQRVDQLAEVVNALSEGDARPVLKSTVATIGAFGFRGDPRWTYNLRGEPVFDPLTATLFYGGLLLALSRLRQQRYFFISVWFAVSLLPSILTPQYPSTVRMVGGLPVVFILVGFAVQWIWERTIGRLNASSSRTRTMSLWLLAALSLLGLNVVRTLRNGFMRWPSELNVRLKYQSVLQDIGGYWLEHPDESIVIAADFYRPITADTLRRNLAIDPAARWVQTGPDVAGALVFPVVVNGTGSSHLYVPEYAAPSPLLMAKAGFPQDPTYRSLGQPSFAVYERALAPVAPTFSYAVSFENVITFLGYEPESLSTGTPIELFTFWQVDAPLPSDLAIFVHLLTPDGELVSQHDGLDAIPTTMQSGDIVMQRHVLARPKAVAEEPYSLQVGLYKRASSSRLVHPGEPSDLIVLTSDIVLAEG
jgi:hypothetical protein